MLSYRSFDAYTKLVFHFLYFRKIVYNDLVAITPEQYFKQITKRVAAIKAVSVSVAMEESCENPKNLSHILYAKCFMRILDI